MSSHMIVVGLSGSASSCGGSRALRRPRRVLPDPTPDQSSASRSRASTLRPSSTTSDGHRCPYTLETISSGPTSSHLLRPTTRSDPYTFVPTWSGVAYVCFIRIRASFPV
jgi:hypothetical protein